MKTLKLCLVALLCIMIQIMVISVSLNVHLPIICFTKFTYYFLISGGQVHGLQATIFTSGVVFSLCFVIFMGLKLRWFRARINLRQPLPSSNYGSVSGTYRPRYRDLELGHSFRNHNVASTRDAEGPGQLLDRNHTARSTVQVPHHRSMPNLTPKSNQYSNNLENKVKTTNNSVPQQNKGRGKAPAPKPPQINTSQAKDSKSIKLTESNNTPLKAPAPKSRTSKAPAPKTPSAPDGPLSNNVFEKVKIKQNGTIPSSSAEGEHENLNKQDHLDENVFYGESSITRKNDYIQAARGIPYFETDSEEEDELDLGNINFVTSNGRPHSFADNNTRMNFDDLTISRTNFLDYEEFDT